MAEVFPELFGPMNTTGFPNSTSTAPKRLKLRTVSLVSIRCLPLSRRRDYRPKPADRASARRRPGVGETCPGGAGMPSRVSAAE